MTLYSCLLPLSEKNNLIPYSIFDHLTSGGWGISESVYRRRRQHNGQKKKDKQRSIKHTHKRADKIYVLLFIAQLH
jgi:hypothetical protein